MNATDIPPTGTRIGCRGFRYGRLFVALVAIFAQLTLFSAGSANAENRLKAFCDGDCRVHLFAGDWVEDAMLDIFTKPIPPWDWDYWENERILGLAFSKRTWTIFRVIDVEPEIGLAYRTGLEEAYEIWGAFYFRFDRFPWQKYLYTSIAISTGINYASTVTELERQRARGSEQGSKILHYLSPEISFALPKYQQYEVVFRLHHRSGGYGAINDTYGGAQYGTVGLRVAF